MNGFNPQNPRTMRARNLLFLIVPALLLGRCEMMSEGPAKDEAEVYKRMGVKVFVLAEPLHDHQPIGKVQNDLIAQVREGSDKEGWERVKDLFGTAKKNMDFSKLVDHMAEKAAEKYPNQADGIIFKKDLSECEVITFKE